MKIIYVSPDGSDITGTGSGANPYRTIAKALTVFVSGDQIRLFSGTYNETDSIVFNGFNGSMLGEGLGAIIQPVSLSINTAIITIQNSTNFYLTGLSLRQALDTTSNSIGIYVNNSENVYIHNCEIQDFISSDVYTYGIYGNSTSRLGRIEQCIVKNMASNGTEIAGIVGNFDIVHCNVRNISGAGRCDSYGIYVGNPYVPGTPTDVAMVFGIRQTNFNEYVRTHAVWSSWTEYNNNEMNAPVGDAPIYGDYISLCMVNYEPAQACWGYNKTNNTDFDVYISAVKVNADTSINVDLPYLVKYNKSTNTFTQEALPVPAMRYYRMLQAGLGGVVINDTVNMIYVCDIQDDPEIGSGNWFLSTFVYDGTNWTNYIEAEGPRFKPVSKIFMANNSGTPVAFATNNGNGAGIAWITRFDNNLHTWSLEYQNPDGYDDLIYDIHGNSYNNIYAIAYKTGEITESALYHYDGNAWSYIECTPLFGARFSPTSICVTDTDTIHLVGSTSFDNPGQYWYYNGSTWENRTAQLPIPSDMAELPIFSGVRAKTDSFIVITAWDWDTYGEYLYTLKDGSWTVTKTSYDPVNWWADSFSIGCGDNIFVGNINL